MISMRAVNEFFIRLRFFLFAYRKKCKYKHSNINFI